MQGTFYYCVLKNYSGLFRKKFKGNTHLFFIPLDNGLYGYFGLIGEMLDKESGIPQGMDQYACKLILKLPEEVVSTVIEHQIEYFKGRLQIIEQVDVDSKKVGSGEYFIDVNKGNFIRSDMVLKYQLEYSTSDKRIYTIIGDLDFMSKEISDLKQLKADLIKQAPIMTKLSKIKEGIDVPLLAECCRTVIIESAYKKFNLDKFSKICEYLDTKSDEQVISKVFKQNVLTEAISIPKIKLPKIRIEKPHMSEVEPYSRTAVKYGVAAGAGAALGLTAFKAAKHISKLKMSPFGPIAGLIGGGIAASALYLYRRLSNPCRQKVKDLPHHKRRMAYHQCKADSARRVINRLVDGMNDCRNAKDAEKCIEKMQKNIDRWKQVYQEEIVKAKQSIYAED